MSEIGDRRSIRRGILRRAAWVGFAILVLLSVASAVQATRNGMEKSVDLQWHEGKLIVHGVNPYEPDLPADELERLVGEFNPADSVQLPSALLLFAPLSVFDHQTAKAVWTLLNFIVTPIIVLLLVAHFDPKHLSKRHLVLLLVVLTSSSSWRHTIGNGQHGLIAFALFLLSYHHFSKQRLTYSIFFLSISMIKYTLILPFCAFFLPDLRRGAVVIFGALAVHITLTVMVGFLVQEHPVALIGKSLEAAANLQSKGWVDVFSLYHGQFPDAFGSFPPMLFATVLALMASVVCRHHIDSRVASIVAIVSLLLVYHRIYDAFVLFVLFVHLYALAVPVGSSWQGGRLDPWQRVEVIMGAGIVAYAFFFEKLVHELQERGLIVATMADGIELLFAAALYSYLLSLMARAWWMGSLRAA